MTHERNLGESPVKIPLFLLDPKGTPTISMKCQSSLHLLLLGFLVFPLVKGEANGGKVGQVDFAHRLRSIGTRENSSRKESLPSLSPLFSLLDQMKKRT